MSDLERVRERLRAQGYLGGRMERFVLRDAFSEEAASRRRLRVAAKAATIVAPAFALWTAGSTLASDARGFRWGDGLVLGAYDFLIAWPVGLIVFFALARIGSAAALRRAPDVAALLCATLGGAAVVWWLAGLQGPVGGRFLWGAVGAVCVGFFGWCAGLATWLGGVAPDRPLPVRMRRGTVAAGTAVLAAAIGAWAASGETAPLPAPETWKLRANAPPLTVLGIDGLDDGLFSALLDGRATDWDRALAGSAGGSWQRAVGQSPAALWTSVWTGVEPAVHGVGAADETRLPGIGTALSGDAATDPWRRAWRRWLPGRRAPASTAGRRVRTLWEVVALREPVSAVGWWASWPAVLDRADGGFIVSDRTLAKLQAGGDRDRETWPPAYFDRLHAEFPRYRDSVAREFDERLAPRVPAEWKTAAEEAHAIDAFSLDQLERLRAAGVSRFHAAYLPGLDILGHRIRERMQSGNSRAMLDARAVLETHLDWLGVRIAELRLGTENDGWLLIADPGRGAAAGDRGFWRAGGSGIRSNCVAEVDAATAWFPWILHWGGFPVLEGRGVPPALAACLDPASSPATVAAFPPPPESRGSTSAFDDEMLERLRSLGYVQ